MAERKLRASIIVDIALKDYAAAAEFEKKVQAIEEELRDLGATVDFAITERRERKTRSGKSPAVTMRKNVTHIRRESQRRKKATDEPRPAA